MKKKNDNALDDLVSKNILKEINLDENESLAVRSYYHYLFNKIQKENKKNENI